MVISLAGTRIAADPVLECDFKGRCNLTAGVTGRSSGPSVDHAIRHTKRIALRRAEKNVVLVLHAVSVT
jgi:hypothetical protein